MGMGGASMVELFPLLLAAVFWIGGFVLFFYLAFRAVKALEVIAASMEKDKQSL